MEATPAHLATAELGRSGYLESQLPIRMFHIGADNLSCVLSDCYAKDRAHGIQALAWSPDGKVLASGADDGAVRMFDACFTETMRFQCKRGVRSLAWRSNSTVIAAGCSDGSATLFDVERAVRVRRYLYDGNDAVWSVSFAPLGPNLALSDDRYTRVLDTDSGDKLWEVCIGHFGWYLGWKPDASQILVGSGSFPGLQLLDAHTGRSRLEFALDGVRLVAAWRPDGKRFVVAQGSLVLSIKSSTGELLLPRFLHVGKVTAISWTMDGNLLATGATDKLARVFQAANGKLLISIEHRAEVRCVQWKSHVALNPQIQMESNGTTGNEANLATPSEPNSPNTSNQPNSPNTSSQSRFRGLTNKQLSALHVSLPNFVGVDLALLHLQVDLPVLSEFLVNNRSTVLRLQILDLSGNPGTLGAICTILNDGTLNLRELQCLFLCNCAVTPLQLEDFLQTPDSCRPCLKDLKLEKNPGILDSVETKKMFFNTLDALQVLNLSACSVKYRQNGFIDMMSYCPPPLLNKLILASNPGIEFKSLSCENCPWRLESVAELSLSSCALTGSDLKSLACVVQPSSVIHLDLSWNPEILQDLPNKYNLVSMRVWNHLSLLHLKLSDCEITVDGLTALLLALPESIQSLQLDIPPGNSELPQIMASGRFRPSGENTMWLKETGPVVQVVADGCTTQSDSNGCIVQ